MQFLLFHNLLMIDYLIYQLYLKNMQHYRRILLPVFIGGIIVILSFVFFAPIAIHYTWLEIMAFTWLGSFILFLVATSKIGAVRTLYLLGYLLVLILSLRLCIANFGIHVSWATYAATFGLLIWFFLFLEWGTGGKWRK